MKILTIGNSFSEDATRYLHDIASAAGEDIEVVNLVIGGCPLELHCQNMKDGSKSYLYMYNGVYTGEYAALCDVVESDQWDVITLQQVSHFSFDESTYHPYVDELVHYIRAKQPNAKLLLHQTWAYEDGSERLLVMAGYSRSQDMLSDIKKAYASVARDLGFDGIIPSGEMFGDLLELGVKKLHRDTFHASCGLGRFALGLLWFKALTGKSVSDNGFAKLDEAADETEIKIVKDYIDKKEI